MNTGKYRWHYQTVHHDIWDYDTAANPLVAFDLTIKGTPRKAIASMGKTGWIYLLDRRNGKPILGINEKKVPQSAVQHTYPTQPIPVGQPFAAQCAPKSWKNWKAPDGKKVKIGCIFTPYNQRQFTAFAPAALGGVDWPPSSYSPRTGSCTSAQGQLGRLEGAAGEGVEPAEAARELLPDRGPLGSAWKSRAALGGQGRRHEHAHEPPHGRRRSRPVTSATAASSRPAAGSSSSAGTTRRCRRTTTARASSSGRRPSSSPASPRRR